MVVFDVRLPAAVVTAALHPVLRSSADYAAADGGRDPLLDRLNI
jgi:hypothetical protein